MRKIDLPGRKEAIPLPTEYRHEYKYLCSFDQLMVERRRLELLLRPDPHAGPEGRYLVRSAYFDTPGDDFLRENEDGTDPRAKYRLRIYNCEDRFISLERKAKRSGMTHKDGVAVSRDLADQLLAGRIPAPPPDASPLLTRMLVDMKLLGLQPKVLVQYVRTPFVLRLGNVRITLDERICSSQAVDRFYDREIPLRPVLADRQGLLEVKWDQLLPDYLYHALQLEGLQWTSFSKYYLCRLYNTTGGTAL